ncbi:2'-5' RNA ligase [Ferroacidibacillus organovorans]|uniref:2'-5' RNA ligase n=1 Tax=Ferroacidibacillus organovorans TaxID=1765683 RepID=A0A853KC14_9BACL|nr:2'-5' RNA ligase [Ferroacidibacillus organovorans]OAG94387.1 2'-5' RNA ligase [Ferroacidibacillus organovorans]
MISIRRLKIDGGMTVQYFVGIVPPTDYKERIVEFQKRWQSNRTWEVAEPHITVKAQSGLGDDLRWLESIKRTCASFPRFTVSIDQPKTFGEAVAYLSVESSEIHDFHERLVEAVSPPPEVMKQYMEMERFIPHLTLGQTHWGMSSEEISEMRSFASITLFPFPTFSVDFIRVFQEIEKNTYILFEDIDLA